MMICVFSYQLNYFAPDNRPSEQKYYVIIKISNSFLNATAGLTAAFCGVIIHNRLLIACGVAVTASGSILTHVMWF